MNEKYFDHEYMGFYKPTLWWRIKMWLLGERIVECSGSIVTIWYAYKGKLYLTDYKGLGQL